MSRQQCEHICELVDNLVSGETRKMRNTAGKNPESLPTLNLDAQNLMPESGINESHIYYELYLDFIEKYFDVSVEYHLHNKMTEDITQKPIYEKRIFSNTLIGAILGFNYWLDSISTLDSLGNISKSILPIAVGAIASASSTYLDEKLQYGVRFGSIAFSIICGYIAGNMIGNDTGFSLASPIGIAFGAVVGAIYAIKNRVKKITPEESEKAKYRIKSKYTKDRNKLIESTLAKLNVEHAEQR